MRALLASGRGRRGVQAVQYILTVAGALALGYCLAVFLYAKYYQFREARNFAREVHLKGAGESSALAAGAAVALPGKGGLVGRLEIPRIGVSVMVVEGADDSQLKRAVGHIPGTALPGEPGNVGIAGHRDTFFRPLRFIHRDDTITLSTLRSEYRYRVVSTQVVGPEDVQVLNPTGRDSLTLVTCFPFYYVGSAPKRFIVRAELTSGI